MQQKGFPLENCVSGIFISQLTGTGLPAVCLSVVLYAMLVDAPDTIQTLHCVPCRHAEIQGHLSQGKPGRWQFCFQDFESLIRATI